MTKASHQNPERPILTREELRHLASFKTATGNIDVKGLLAAYHEIIDTRRYNEISMRRGISTATQIIASLTKSEPAHAPD